jgi:2,4'-dihydroxyacetophenone dioxygenase
VDPVRGEVVAGFRMPPGTDMAAHYHTGTVIVYTVRGSWRYLEHDWIARPGDIVYETAASLHKPVVVGDDEVETITITTGELLFVNDAGAIIARENAKTSLERYEAYCTANGLRQRLGVDVGLHRALLSSVDPERTLDAGRPGSYWRWPRLAP